jgi:thiamine-monophosphate kinase
VVSGERDLVAWLRRSFGPTTRELVGDDAALLTLRGDWALTTDSQIEGVHFPAGLSPRLLGQRLLAVNLSDLAAVGARPAYALLALSAPRGWPARELLRGLRPGLRRHGMVLAGGDVASGPVPGATLTLLGRRPPRGRWVRRTGARAGDRLWVGGFLGESAAGQRLMARGARWEAGRVTIPAQLDLERAELATARRAVRRHLLPEPQLELGEWLGKRRRAAAIDLSDGFALDLHRLLEASGVGAEVVADALPTAPGFPNLASRLGEEPLELALGGGEDYVLLFALPEGVAPPAFFDATEVGRVTRRREVALLTRHGPRPLPPTGWDHLEESTLELHEGRGRPSLRSPSR